MKKILFVVTLLINVVLLHAQNVEIVEDAEVEILMQKHIDENRSSSMISGWRIQLLATTDRRKVEIAESNFLRDYPAITVSWTHNKPYYKLRAGAFATKLDATKVLKELKNEFPSAFLTKANINISELLVP